MLVNRMTRTLKSLAESGGKFLPVTGAMALAMTLAPALVPVAQAGDYDTSISGSGQEGHFVRIGLGKSIVIRLPAEAKDVIVGDPAVVDAVVRTKSTAYLFARTVGQTNIFFFDGQGRQIMNIDLEVALDMTALQKLIKRTLPGSRITVDTINDKVVLGGTAANASEAKTAEDLAVKFAGDPAKVVNAMKMAGGDQVTLKVRVVEMQRDVMKQLGINLNNLAIDVGNVALNFATSNPIASPYFFGGITGGNDDFNIDASIQAMENDGVLNMLAEPTLTAISGQSASFLAGGQFPYVTGYSCDDSNRNCVQTITYKDYGVKLGFTPIVLSEGRINLKIATEVSELTDSETGSLSTRSAETTLELPSGGSMMLAGLIRDSSRNSVDGTPGLKNLPVLGALFRSQSWLSNQTELVVIVTPYIVNPVAERQLKSPNYRYQTATDWQTNLFGRLNQVYGTPGNHPDGVYHGNVGFIIE